MLFLLKKCSRASAVLLIGLILLGSFAALELQAGRCEDALVRCLYDVPYTNPWLCATGWVFCKKYIE